MRLIQRQLLKRHDLKRTTRTLDWIRRFINKSRVKEEVKGKKGPLSINETEFELIEMIKIYHSKHKGETKFKQTEQQLNFKKMTMVYINVMGEQLATSQSSYQNQDYWLGGLFKKLIIRYCMGE